MRTKHVLALIVFVAFCGVAVATAMARLFDEQRGRIDDALRQLAQYRSQTAETPLLNERLKQIDLQASSLTGLMKAESPSLAAAELQGEINAIVQRHAGEMMTSQTLPPETLNGFDRITVKNELSVPIMSLRAIVYGVETHAPYMFIERMVITGPRDWPQDRTNAPEPRLVVNWTVFAFRRSTPT
jgi:hypothetical protein